MRLRENIIQIWKAKGQIIEGVTNSIFKKEDVEEIANQRMLICRQCNLYGKEGCVVPGTHPCCNQDKGGCGCSLAYKTRSLSSGCPLSKWDAILTQEEEDLMKRKLGL